MGDQPGRIDPSPVFLGRGRHPHDEAALDDEPGPVDATRSFHGTYVCSNPPCGAWNDGFFSAAAGPPVVCDRCGCGLVELGM